jgi:ABC-2 type transport system ATP-binding protein
VIEIQDLYKYYGTKRALGPVTVSIERGEVIGLLGLNGAGKTTTLRVLACDVLPSAGSVRVDGMDVTEHPDAVRRRVGYLPDRPPLYDEMRVRDYLRFTHALRGGEASQAERRIGGVAERLGLQRWLDVPLFSLSHGYRQRVGIAQAIVHDPDLVVLDEPISGLDPVQIVEMRALVRSLSSDHTVIVSSHILSEISETCDRLLVLREGRIAAAGTEQELSGQLLAGVSVELSLRAEASAREAGLRLLRSVAGVSTADVIPALEAGPNVLSYRVRAGNDVRGELVRAITTAGFSLISLAKTDTELEDVFLRLAGGGGSAGVKTA